MVHENAIDSFINRHLHQENIHVKNYEHTRRKIFAMFDGGMKQFEVVSDFDRTMSKHRHNGKENPTCHGIFETDPEVTPEVQNELKDLRNQYYPIEMNQDMKIAEKLPHMECWWQQTHAIIIKNKPHRQALVRTVKGSGLVLREHAHEFTDLLATNGIPILVFSAGLGDVIRILLEHFGMLTANMRVISNFMKFDENDVVVDFTTPVIHTFNKNAATVSDEICRRSCVLLFGDTISDTRMADGATGENGAGTILRIGFLNDFINEHLDEYKACYDIVIANDGSFEVPLALLKLLLNHWKSTDGVGDGTEKLNST